MGKENETVFTRRGRRNVCWRCRTADRRRVEVNDRKHPCHRQCGGVICPNCGACFRDCPRNAR